MQLRKLPKDEFDSIYRRVPRLTVEVLARTDEGIVLSRREIPPCVGMWHIPGGTVLYGETLEQAVKRVAAEELGLSVAVERLLGVIEYDVEEYGIHPVGIAYLARAVSGRLRGSDQGQAVQAFRAIPEDTIPEQQRFLAAHWATIAL